MAQITLDQATEGMVLGANVHDKRGRLLMPAGKELTERNLSAMRMWGVTSVEVEGDGPEEKAAPEFDEETLARADAEVEDLFCNAGEHEFLVELRKLSRTRMAEQIAREAPASEPMEVA